MAINRFFQPSRGQYVSQFVPERLPTDLMMGVLGNKQGQEDQKQAMLDKDGEFDYLTVPGAITDSSIKEEKLKGHRAKMDQLYDIDVTSAEGRTKLREYKDHIRSLQNDEDIKTAISYRQQYDKDKEFEEKVRKDPSKYGVGEGVFRNQMEWNNYISGEGQKGSWNLGQGHEVFDPINTWQTHISNVKSDGWEKDMHSLAQMQASGYNIRKGWKGISQNKVIQTYNNNERKWLQGKEGESFRDRLSMQLGMSSSEYQKMKSKGSAHIKSLGKTIDNKEFEEVTKDMMRESFLGQALPIVHNQTKEHIDILNKFKLGFDRDTKEDAARAGGAADAIVKTPDGATAKKQYDSNQNTFTSALNDFYKSTGQENKVSASSFKDFAKNAMEGFPEKEEKGTLKRNSAGFITEESMQQTIKETAEYLKNNKQNMSTEDYNEALQSFNNMRRTAFKINNDPYRHIAMPQATKAIEDNVKKINTNMTSTGINDLVRDLKNNLYSELKINLSPEAEKAGKRLYESLPKGIGKHTLENKTEVEIQKMKEDFATYLLGATEGSGSGIYQYDKETKAKTTNLSLVYNTPGTKEMDKAIKDQSSIDLMTYEGHAFNITDIAAKLNKLDPKANTQVITNDMYVDPVTQEQYYALTYNAGDDGTVFNPETKTWEDNKNAKNKVQRILFLPQQEQTISSNKGLEPSIREGVIEGTMTPEAGESALASLRFSKLTAKNNLSLTEVFNSTFDLIERGYKDSGVVEGIKYYDPLEERVVTTPDVEIKTDKTTGGNLFYYLEVDGSRKGASAKTREAIKGELLNYIESFQE